jgi:phage gp29-like protein
MPFKDPEARRAYQRDRYAAQKPMGRPRAVEGEQMVVAWDLMASMTRPESGGVYFLAVDEIVRRQGWKTYKDMRHDDQVKACLAFKKILIGGRTFEIKEANDTPQAKKIAEFVGWCLQDIDFKSVLREAMTALEFGYSFGELVWTRKIWQGTQVVCLEKIAHRDPQTLELKMDPHGNVMGARQICVGKNVELEPNKFWLYSHNKTFGDPYGVSDLRSAYRAWWAKKFVIQFWNVFLERMGSPMTKVTYPTGASQELKDTLKKVLSNLGSKTEILVPQGVEVNLIEATRSGNATYEQALSFHNNSIARAMLMVALLGTNGDQARVSGTDSQSYLHLRIIFKMADEISQAITKSFMQQVVKQLVEMNFDGAEDLMPTFVWQDYGQFEGVKIADEIRQLHAAGLLDLDQSDVNYVRSVLGLPLRLEGMPEDEVIRPIPMPPPGDGTPPPAAPQGNDRAKKGEASKNSERRTVLVLEEVTDEVPGT